MTDITVTEVARHFAAYIDRVAHRGERFRLLRGGRAVAELMPVPAGRRLRELPALLASCARLGPEGAEAMAEDLEAARAELADREALDPWRS
jgi:antitoxin (DNA-binding transcriptional repressor) of toxin-antitoxin stability system